ncbi:MAG: rod shape-determining protein MreC [Limisphaerales bacterium]
MKTTRTSLETVVSPIYLITQSPYLLADQVGEQVSSHSSLLEENHELERQIQELAHVSQQFIALKAENDRLRELLGSQARLPHDVLIVEVVGIVPTPGSFELIVDKGSDAGITEGQAVLDAGGLVGQVVSVAAFTSRVLVLTDRNHAVPVQINRNGVRSIAGGTGELNELHLESVPVSADIVEGDLLETSGLGGRFPSGYPVGRVSSVVVEPTSAYAQVIVTPAAALDRTRHVLVIFEASINASSVNGSGPDDGSGPDNGSVDALEIGELERIQP